MEILESPVPCRQPPRCSRNAPQQIRPNPGAFPPLRARIPATTRFSQRPGRWYNEPRSNGLGKSKENAAMKSLEFILIIFTINVLPFLVMIGCILLMTKIWKGKI
jgi:hypothetical protein